MPLAFLSYFMIEIILNSNQCRFVILALQSGYPNSGLTTVCQNSKAHSGQQYAYIFLLDVTVFLLLHFSFLQCRYFAPEYFMHGIVDEKTDVYSFGVLLLELITGRRALDELCQSLVLWVIITLEQTNFISTQQIIIFL